MKLSMSRDYKQYLDDILEAAQRIQDYLQGVSRQQLETDRLRRDAIVYNLQIIGEAVKQIPPEVREKYPNIEWRRIAGLRDIIAHEYFSVNLNIIWDIVQNKLAEGGASIERPSTPGPFSLRAKGS